MACCNFIFIREEMAWREDSLGEGRGHAFSSPPLKATALRHVNTYASAHKTSLHELNASKIKWHQTSQLHSRNRPDSPAQVPTMQLQCSQTTKLLSVHSEVGMDASSMQSFVPWPTLLILAALLGKKESSTLM